MFSNAAVVRRASTILCFAETPLSMRSPHADQFYLFGQIFFVHYPLAFFFVFGVLHMRFYPPCAPFSPFRNYLKNCPSQLMPLYFVQYLVPRSFFSPTTTLPESKSSNLRTWPISTAQRCHSSSLLFLPFARDHAAAVANK